MEANEIAFGEVNPDALDLKRAGTACTRRGFHGPFGADRAYESYPAFSACLLCGAKVSVAEHGSAYQIALFHGLVS